VADLSELADNELRQAANELLHEDYPIEDPMSLDDHERKVSKIKVTCSRSPSACSTSMTASAAKGMVRSGRRRRRRPTPATSRPRRRCSIG